MKSQYEEKEPLAIEGPPDDEDNKDAEEASDDDPVEEANKLLDELGLPNYYDVEMRLDEPEMTATKQRNYLQKVLKDAESRRKQAVSL